MKQFFTLSLLLLTLSSEAAFPRLWHFPFIPFLPAGTRFTANAGPDQAVIVTTATMAASVTPSGTYSYTWAQLSGPTPASFDDAHILNPVITRGAVGTYVFRLTAIQGLRYSSDTVTITYGSPANTPPFVTPPTANVSTNEDRAQSASFTIGDSETTAASLIVLAVSGNTNVLRQSGISITSSGPLLSTRTITMTPVANASGVSTISVSVVDAQGAIATMSFTATWTAINDPPTLSSIGAQSGFEDTPKVINFTIGDVETSVNSLLAFGSSSSPLISGITVTGTGANRTATITPRTNANGVASITISVTDGSATTSETFNLTIAPVNDPAVITASTTLIQTTNGVQSADVTLTLSDVEDAVTALITAATSSNQGIQPDATLLVSGTGATRTIHFTPLGVGTATITVSVLDSSFAGNSVNITEISAAATPGNTAPTINGPGNQTTTEDNPAPLANLAITVGDAEQSAGSLVLTATSSNPTLTPILTLGGSGANRTITIGTGSNQFGGAVITLRINDGALTTTNTFQVTVSSVNDAPILTLPNVWTTQEDVAFSFSAGVSDVETAASSLNLTAISSNPALVPNGNIAISPTGSTRTVTVRPVLNQFGTTTLTFTLSDGSASVNGSVAVTVTSQNDPPTITALSDKTVALNTPSTQSFTVGDVETPAANLTPSGSSSNTGLVPNASITFGGSGASRTVTVTPASGQSGSAVITVLVTDGNGGSASRTFNFIVTPAGGGRTFFVSASGSSGNTGLSTASPWNMGSVLSPGTKGLIGGDTVWIMPGLYVGRFVFSGNYSTPIVFRGLNRPFGATANTALFDRQGGVVGDGTIDFASGCNNVWIQDLSFINTALRTQNGNTDRGNAFYVTQRGNNKIINCNIKDSGNGVGIEDDASLPAGNMEVYGIISGYNGQAQDASDQAHGHAYYVQAKNRNYTIEYTDCWGHSSMGQGWQSRGGDSVLYFWNYHVTGCAFWNNGFPSGSPTRNVLFGGGEHNNFYTFRSNFCYYPDPGGPSLYFTYPTADPNSVGNPPTINTNLLCTDNVSWGGDFRWARWRDATITNNIFVGTSSRPAMYFYPQFGTLGSVVDYNQVYGAIPYELDTVGQVNSATWQAQTGFGVHDNLHAGKPTSTLTYLRNNKYDSKQANLIVFNPSGASTVTVSLAGFLSNGDSYDIYSGTDWTRRHTSGVYSGSVVIPMTGFPIMTMVGFVAGSAPFAGSPRSPEPEFGAFRILKTN